MPLAQVMTVANGDRCERVLDLHSYFPCSAPNPTCNLLSLPRFYLDMSPLLWSVYFDGRDTWNKPLSSYICMREPRQLFHSRTFKSSSSRQPNVS